jgi:hypothetical protein
LKKISPSNKKLLAKTKNNLAMCIFLNAEKNQNKEEMEKAVLIFKESLELFKALDDANSIKEVETNMSTAESKAKSAY